MMNAWSRRVSTLLAAAALAAAVGSPAPKADPGRTPEIDPEQRAAFEAVIRDYLKQNPSVVIDAIRTYQEEREAADRHAATLALADTRGELEKDQSSPIIGNPDGDVTVVEFFDYRCGYCKRVLPSVRKLLQEDGRIRYVLKEYPILGPDSVTAARASLAVWKVAPEHYMDFHTTLLGSKGALTEERILATAGDAGVDVDAVRAEMSKPWVEDAIKRNFELGRRLKINGTPAFIVGEQIIPGAIDLEAMRGLIAEARKG